MKKDKSKDLELADALVSNKDKRSDKLWKKLLKELDVLQDNNYTARIIFDYVEKHYS